MSTRAAVLHALREADDAVSGEVLAASLGVSRTAVAKHVAALKRSGYEIAAVPGAGYRLISAPDLSTPDEVAPLLHDPFWVRVEGGPHTASTNDDARSLAREGAPEGTVVVAGAQAKGRGRLGREWTSPPGGAYFSAVLRPGKSPAEVSSLSLAVALGVARGLATLGVVAQVKWPNDVLVDGRKVAGVLLEMAAESDRVEWVVAGVGINVSRSRGAFQGAAHVADAAPEASAAVVAAAALDAVARTYREWLDGGFASLKAEYQSRAWSKDTEVVVRDADGGVRAAGVLCGVDDEGRLLVACGSEIVAVSSGEVTLRAPGDVGY